MVVRWIGLLVALLAGFGAGASVFGVSSGDVVEVSPAAGGSPTSAALTSQPDYDGIVVGPALLVPGEFEMDGDAAVFRYQLESLAPLDGIESASIAQFVGDSGTAIDPATVTPVFPARWTLMTASAEYPGTTAAVESRSARFDVPSSFSPSQVTGVRIDSYRVPLPIGERFELWEGEPTHEIAPGVSLSLIQVVDQGAQTIVQIEILSADAFNREELTVEGIGTQWVSAVREAEGRPRYTLRHAGDEPPQIMELRVHGRVWLEIDDPVTIIGDG